MVTYEEVKNSIKVKKKAHPRILLNNKILRDTKKEIEENQELKKFNDLILMKAEKSLTIEYLERKLIGKRLLHTSREAFSRITTLSWAYLFTKKEKYAKRAIGEMIAVSKFKDWNPSHFLDVGEMTAAMSIGYDWLYSMMDAATKEIIKDSIVELGMKESYINQEKNCWWITCEHNWNQVCHGGMVLGALAVLEEEEDLGIKVIQRALNNVKLVMDEYYPDGAYPEGPSYWTYGTTYNILMIESLITSLDNAFDLDKHEGLLKSAEYYLFSSGPSGKYWNYSDCGLDGEDGLNSLVYWFSKKTKDSSLAWNQEKLLKSNLLKDSQDLTESRMSVFNLFWRRIESVEKPKKLSWIGRGRTPVGIFRSGWEDESIYLAIKGGTAGSNHAHMDAGSFIIEGLGIRWGLDLGKEEYRDVESQGIDLWNMEQDSERWDIFRYNNLSHNTLTVNDDDHLINGSGRILNYSEEEQKVVVDLTSLFKDGLESVYRTAKLDLEDEYPVEIMDDIIIGKNPVKVRWQMATVAEIINTENNTITLSQQGKKMKMKVYNDDLKFKVLKEPQKNSWDSENPGLKFIGFEMNLNKKVNKIKVGMKFYE